MRNYSGPSNKFVTSNIKNGSERIKLIGKRRDIFKFLWMVAGGTSKKMSRIHKWNAEWRLTSMVKLHYSLASTGAAGFKWWCVIYRYYTTNYMSLRSPSKNMYNLIIFLLFLSYAIWLCFINSSSLLKFFLRPSVNHSSCQTAEIPVWYNIWLDDNIGHIHIILAYANYGSVPIATGDVAQE